MFGGQVAGQALVAAGRTVDPARFVHSLHGYFVRPGDPTVPIEFTVETIRDGRSFSVRRSTAQQHGRTIFFMSASFQVVEQGLDHHTPAPDRRARPRRGAHHARLGGPVPGPRRQSSTPPRRPSTSATSASPAGCRRATAPPTPSNASGCASPANCPDDPLIHACALTYASDLSLLDTVLSMHGEVWGPGGVIGASLDHALWLHRPFRADEWFLYDCTSPSASGSRGLASGRMFTEDGRHIASAVQEGLLRRIGA